jgi:ribosomal protein S27AE
VTVCATIQHFRAGGGRGCERCGDVSVDSMHLGKSRMSCEPCGGSELLEMSDLS